MLSVPPETSTSPAPKFVEGSLSVNARLAVWPVSSVALSLETETVGGVISQTRVSTVIVTVLLASAPSTLKLPAASENLLLATLTTPGVLLLAVGVNVAE